VHTKTAPAPTKMHRPKWRLCRKIEECSNFKMMYHLLKINVSISKKLGDLTFESTLVIGDSYKKKPSTDYAQE
jgi:hypothetical protein